jgi:hypothetical protein
MDRSSRIARLLPICSAACFLMAAAAPAQNISSVKRVQVLGNRTPVEIEIEASDPVVPKAEMVTGPDRLVVDFPNAKPAEQMHNQTLNRGEVKSVRVGLFSSDPPVTRVVFDLSGPEPFQIFPSGRTVIIKLGAPGAKSTALVPATLAPASLALAKSGAALMNASLPEPTPVQATPPPPPPLEVTFANGKLSITAHKATLSEILFAIHQRTGAEIPIPAGAEQEQVVAELGPAPAPEVLSNLLNGSKFNFMILSSAKDPAILERVILTARPEGPAPAYHPLPPAPVQTASANNPTSDDDSDADSATHAPAPPPPAPNANPGAQPTSPAAEAKTDSVPD